MTVPDLTLARAAVERGDFGGALEALAADPEAPGSPEGLEVAAAARYGLGDLEGAIGSWERLSALEAGAGRSEAAARAAAMVAVLLLCESGLMAAVRGWAARSRRLLGDAPPGAVHALLALVTAYERLLTGDPEGAAAHAREAVELGERFGVDPARGLGRTAVARIAMQAGEVEHGLALLDELAVDLAAGEFDPLTTGNVYCELVCAALWVGHQDRAREWTTVMDRWRTGPALGSTHGRCRIHRAELLRISGPVASAEAEALGACAELRPWMRREYGWPLTELGNIRLRRGDLDGAEEAFLEAHGQAWAPQPGLALLRLAQGQPEVAAAMVRAEIEHPMSVPWKERPPFGGLRLVPLLAAKAAISAAAGDAAGAEEAATQLEEICGSYGGPLLRAEARLARARAALVAGRPEEAIEPAQDAASAWTELEAPYDAGEARVVLGSALAACGRGELARVEWRAAATGFGAFGAHRRAAEVARLADLAGAPARPAPAPAVAWLERDGERWRIGYADKEVSVPDLKGVALLARLLAAPGREFHALDLAGAGVVEPGLPVLDQEAREAYRRRLVEVEADLEEAERDNDEARRLLAARDRDYLLAELAGAVGLAGRARLVGGTAERARTSVTRSLRYGLRRITALHPVLGAHLARAVRTGACCSYQPDPVAPLAWRVRC
ncbi:hypothetical protein E8D34_09475 [Nocardioides sp. GY 10113]|uniref:hypothetical protein n=1 Tax=Nocardioides sp. GY 10113 TaxID=2569761 RepID=UPI0010A7C607|nr:hypothetical protein [Nocardioides sp. GY 10113]TIC87357.1 hypothetical protein E8D34_09475 [Nocardioides sp. GY 10113]